MNKNLRLYLLFIFTGIVSVIIYYNNFYNKTLIPNESPKHDFAIEGKAHIVDGDSLRINDYEIRLSDIDAPEYNQYCHNENQIKYPCGNEATKFIRQLIKQQPVRCLVIGKDYYNRFLATCFVENININKQMVKYGWAIKYSPDSEYYAVELEANINKRGMWQGSFISPKQFRKLHARKR